MAKTKTPFQENTYKQVEIEIPKPAPLNIEPISGGSTLKEGDLISPKYRTSRSGWRVSSDGTAEFQDGIFNGTFSIGGTQVTVDSLADLGDALTKVNTAGGGTVFLDNGTYILTSDIEVPSGVALVGVSRDGVILDCNGSYSVKITGSDVYSTGTISINDNSTTVTGSGTTFTSAMVGQHIWIDKTWFEITGFSSTTSITIGSAYLGTNISGDSFVIATINTKAQLSQLTITNATGSGVVCSYALEPNLEDLFIYNNGIGLNLDFVQFPRIFLTSTENGVNADLDSVSGFKVDFCEFSKASTGAGVSFTDCANATFFDSSARNNAGNGVELTNCNDIAFVSLSFNNNSDNGAELVSGNQDIQFIAATSDGNTNDGYSLTATSDRITIVSTSVINNGGYGINIVASSCDENYVVAPAFSNNTLGDVNDSGTNTTVLGRGGSLFVAPADTYLLTSDDAEDSRAASSYDKIKEINIGNYAGKIRVKFDMKNSGLGNTVNARIYRNGVAVGTEQATSSGVYSTKTEDILGWESNDLMQVYAKGNGADSCFVNNFRIYADKTLVPVVL